MEFWLQFIQTGKFFTKWIGFDREVTFGLKKKNDIKNLLGDLCQVLAHGPAEDNRGG